jgi:poly(3-hydroxybutyrate) depolymerase
VEVFADPSSTRRESLYALPMRCARHGLAFGPDGACVVCRREASVPPPVRARSRLVPLLLVLVALLAVAAVVIEASGGAAAIVAALPKPCKAGVLETTNSAGRSGSYFLPSGYEGHPLPVVVAIHGSGSAGAVMVALLRGAAEERKFIVVAPDSRVAPNGMAAWQVPDRPGDSTDDFGHIRRCLDEVRAMPGVRIDPTRTLIVGHSGGGSTAPYVASNDDFYRAFAVLHGGVFAGGLGPRRVRGWFSTGDRDPIRPFPGVEAACDDVRRVGFDPVELRTFHEGHEIGADELRELVAWWLDRPG